MIKDQSFSHISDVWVQKSFTSVIQVDQRIFIFLFRFLSLFMYLQVKCPCLVREGRTLSPVPNWPHGPYLTSQGQTCNQIASPSLCGVFSVFLSFFTHKAACACLSFLKIGTPILFILVSLVFRILRLLHKSILVNI